MSLEAVRAALFDFHQAQATEAGLRTVYQAWPDEHRPELAKALRKFAGELMSGEEIPHVDEGETE